MVQRATVHPGHVTADPDAATGNCLSATTPHAEITETGGVQWISDGTPVIYTSWFLSSAGLSNESGRE